MHPSKFSLLGRGVAKEHAKYLREHANAMVHMAEDATGEDRACLLSAAHEWLRIAEKLERADQRLLPRWNEIKSHPRYRQG